MIKLRVATKKKKWEERFKKAEEEEELQQQQQQQQNVKTKKSAKSLDELNPLIVKWRATFQEAATDLLQHLRSQMGGGGGAAVEVNSAVARELTLENLLLHFRIDPELVHLDAEADSFR